MLIFCGDFHLIAIDYSQLQITHNVLLFHYMCFFSLPLQSIFLL